MKTSMPNGLIVLSLITISSSLSIFTILRPESHMIWAGQIFRGLPFKLYYSMSCVASLTIGVGLLFRKKWAYFCFMGFSLYMVLLAVANILITEENVLFLIGWPHNSDSLNHFRLIQGVGFLIVFIFAGWLYRYRKFFLKFASHTVRKP